jgi:hypothetical protein
VGRMHSDDGRAAQRATVSFRSLTDRPILVKLRGGELGGKLFGCS